MPRPFLKMSKFRSSSRVWTEGFLDGLEDRFVKVKTYIQYTDTLLGFHFFGGDLYQCKSPFRTTHFLSRWFCHVLSKPFKNSKITLPKLNAKAPGDLKIGKLPKGNEKVLEPSIFRYENVSFRDGTCLFFRSR